MEFCRIHLDQVDSTNNYAAKWLKMTKSITPAVITARIQHQGRGQQQRSWESPPNLNLTCSFVILPKNIQFEQLALFNKSIANAAHTTLSKYHDGNIDIKWPNDIWVNGKKIAGILIENNWKQQSINSSIIGIGINVNQPFAIGDKWCSLFSLTNKTIPLCEVLNELEFNIQRQLALLDDRKFENINRYYHQFLLGKNQSIAFHYRQELLYGNIEKVDDWGRIIIKTSESSYAFRHGEVAIDYNPT
jgi:BirA family biotin operon repressor/biotin-[acetyl-CoA-carboxylase] ligase